MTDDSGTNSTVARRAYLVSYGDTMTALLAFLIVLYTFAKEQTGAVAIGPTAATSGGALSRNRD